MRNLNAIVIVMLAVMLLGSLLAEEKSLDGPKIARLLSGNTIFYDSGAKQFFGAKGSTLYISAEGHGEEGRWRVDGDEYCSHWGRSWDCYEMTGTAERISFLVRFGRDFRGRLAAGNQIEK